MDITVFFGSKLAGLTGQYEYGCVALIKLAIQDAGKDPARISFQEMQEVFKVHLLKRLERIKTKDPAQVTAKMLAILNAQQSLFTMSAR
jgi:hypothetical protein